MEEKINAVFFAIHPPPIEDWRFLAHGVLKRMNGMYSDEIRAGDSLTIVYFSQVSSE